MNNKKNRGMMIDNSIVDEVKDDACSETECVVEKAVRSEEVFEEPKEHEIIDAIVKCIRLNVREEPNLNSKKIGELVTGDEITIDLSKSTDLWYKVFTSSGLDGYCAKDFVEVKQ